MNESRNNSNDKLANTPFKQRQVGCRYYIIWITEKAIMSQSELASGSFDVRKDIILYAFGNKVINTKKPLDF